MCFFFSTDMKISRRTCQPTDSKYPSLYTRGLTDGWILSLRSWLGLLVGTGGEVAAAGRSSRWRSEDTGAGNRFVHMAAP
jgi:hypothetical protein